MSGVPIPVGARNYSSSKTSRPAVGPKQPHPQWVSGFSPGDKGGQGVKLTILLYLQSRLRTSTAIPIHALYSVMAWTENYLPLNRNVHYIVHKSLPLVPVLSQINLPHNPNLTLLHLLLILDLWRGTSLSGFRTIFPVYWHIHMFRRSFRTFWLLNMGSTRCPETSIKKYQSTPRNIPEEQRPQTQLRKPIISLPYPDFVSISLLRNSCYIFHSFQLVRRVKFT
jgi:hypothetical protein